MALITCPYCQHEISEFCGNCPHCGIPIPAPNNPNPETQSEAGAAVVETKSVPNTPKRKLVLSFLSANLWNLLGIIVGLVCIVTGIVIASDVTGSPEYATFGGDFYTYTYKGIRSAVGAIGDLTEALGYTVSLIGAIAVCSFGTRIRRKKDAD